MTVPQHLTVTLHIKLNTNVRFNFNNIHEVAAYSYGVFSFTNSCQLKWTISIKTAIHQFVNHIINFRHLKALLF